MGALESYALIGEIQYKSDPVNILLERAAALLLMCIWVTQALVREQVRPFHTAGLANEIHVVQRRPLPKLAAISGLSNLRQQGLKIT
jgi:hypothetical protein